MDKLAILQAAIKHNTKQLREHQSQFIFHRERAKSGNSPTPFLDRFTADLHRERLLKLMKVQKGLRRLIANEISNQKLYRAAREAQ